MSEAHSAVEDESVKRYRRVRALSEGICQPLALEDYGVQSITEASPPKWHLAHTSWFFETFVLRPFAADYSSVDERYRSFFNSYYVSVSELVPQGSRGTFSRPTVNDVLHYRHTVDDAMCTLMGEGLPGDAEPVLEVGLQHEQQHQELLVMDIKAHLAQPPFFPRYREETPKRIDGGASTWVAFDERLAVIGAAGKGFSWDNERPRHRSFVHAFELASLPVSNGDWTAFIEDGGYEDPRLWLSDGWATVRQHRFHAPMYWRRAEHGWERFTLNGLVTIDPHRPVCHVSYYEADAFARWYGARLPTESEWEVAAQDYGNAPVGAFLDDETFEPVAIPGSGLRGLAGNVWEWTSSDYAPYPGYEQPASALGEYNGKFMVNQKVLRGGCCATPRDHYRSTYRNFFYPHQRWPFTGVRLARSGHSVA